MTNDQDRPTLTPAELRKAAKAARSTRTLLGAYAKGLVVWVDDVPVAS